MPPKTVEKPRVIDETSKVPPLARKVQEHVKKLRNEKESKESKEKEPGVLEQVNEFVKEGIKSTMEELRHGSTWEKVFAFAKIAGGIAAVAYVAKKAIDGMMYIGEKMKEQLGETATKTMKGVMIAALGAGLGGAVYEAMKGDLNMGEVTKAFATGGPAGVAKLLLSKSGDGIARLGKDTVDKIKKVAGVSLSDAAAESVEAIDKMVDIDGKKKWLVEELEKREIPVPDSIKNLKTKEMVAYLKKNNVDVADVLKAGGASYLIYRYLGLKGLAINGGIYLMLLKDSEGTPYGKKALEKYRTGMEEMKGKLISNLKESFPGLGSAVESMLPDFKEEGFLDGLIDIAAKDPVKTLAITNAAWMMRGVIFMFMKEVMKFGARTPERAAVSAALMVGNVWARKELIDKIVDSIYKEEKDNDEKEKLRTSLYLMAKVDKDAKTTIEKRLLIDNEAQLLETIGGALGELEIGKKIEGLIKNGDAGIGLRDGGNTVLLLLKSSPPYVLGGQAKASVMSSINQLQSKDNESVVYPTLIGGTTTLVFSSTTFGAAKGYLDLISAGTSKTDSALKVFKSLFPVVSKENRFLWKRGTMEVFEPIASITRRYNLKKVKDGIKKISELIGNLEEGASLGKVKSEIKALESLIKNTYKSSDAMKESLKGNRKIWEISDKVFELKKTLEQVTGRLDAMGNTFTNLHAKEWEGINNLLKSGALHIDEADEVLNRGVMNTLKRAAGKAADLGSDVVSSTTMKGAKENAGRVIESSRDWMKNTKLYEGFEKWKGIKFDTHHIDDLVLLKDKNKIIRLLTKQGATTEQASELAKDLVNATKHDEVMSVLTRTFDADAIRFSPRILKASRIFAKGAQYLGRFAAVAGTVVSAVEAGSAGWEALTTDDSDRRWISSGKAAMWTANLGADAAGTYALLTTSAAATEVVGGTAAAGGGSVAGVVALPMIPVVAVGSNVFDSMYERTITTKEWQELNDSREKAIHEWITSRGGLDSAGEKFRYAFTTASATDIAKEKEKTARKILETVLFRDDLHGKKELPKNYKPDKYRVMFLNAILSDGAPTTTREAEEILAKSRTFSEIMREREVRKEKGVAFVINGVNFLDKKFDNPGWSEIADLMHTMEEFRMSQIPPKKQETFKIMNEKELVKIYCNTRLLMEVRPDLLSEEQVDLAAEISNYMKHRTIIDLPKELEKAIAIWKSIKPSEEQLQELAGDLAKKLKLINEKPQELIRQQEKPKDRYVDAVFRAAKFFGYQGRPTEEALKKFFKEEKAGIYGLYWHEKGWYMNDNFGVDDYMGPELNKETVMKIWNEFDNENRSGKTTWYNPASWFDGTGGGDNFASRNESMYDMVTIGGRDTFEAQSKGLFRVMREALSGKKR